MRITIPKKLEMTGILQRNLLDASYGILVWLVALRVETETPQDYLHTGAISFSSVNRSSTISTGPKTRSPPELRVLGAIELAHAAVAQLGDDPVVQ